jgi:D-tyrosyl-tRNA(Tyr) deacylase
MKAVIQRVKKAQVSVGEEIVGSIQVGFLILLGITHDDT